MGGVESKVKANAERMGKDPQAYWDKHKMEIVENSKLPQGPPPLENAKERRRRNRLALQQIYEGKVPGVGP